MCVSYVKLCFLVAIKQCLVIQFVNCWMYGSRKQWFGYMLCPNTLIDKDSSVRTPGVSTNKCDVYFLNDCFWNFWLSEKNVCSYRCVCVCVREITLISSSYTQGIQKTISEHKNDTKGQTLKQTDYNIRCSSSDDCFHQDNRPFIHVFKLKLKSYRILLSYHTGLHFKESWPCVM